jgi:pimeloyl-ACP methyl ester carboxylesterase
MVLLLLLALFLAVPTAAVEPPGRPVHGTPFQQYSANAGRITFYLSARAAGRSLPIILVIQGTGCESPFVRQNGRIVSGLQSLVLEAAEGRALVMAVEKPGVRFLDNPERPADARTCRPEFVEQYSLDTWSRTLAQALEAARMLPGVERSRTLVVGHSEGAIVALRVSNLVASVTHAAALSGGGPVYLFHMAEFFRKKGMDPEKEVYPCWSQILKDPNSTTRFCWGQTFLQWSSFMRTSMIREALASRSALYFGHGSGDEQNPVSAFDVLRAELAAAGRSAVFDRVEGASHSFDVPGQQAPEGFSSIFAKLVTWFGLERARPPGPR